VYVGTGRGVFKTTNGGRSWGPTSAGVLGKETARQHQFRPSEGYVSSLIVDPRDADVVYAGTQENGVFRTDDAGRSWRHVGPSAPWFRVNKLTFQPGNPSVIYAALVRGVYKSGDGGATWRPAGLRSVFVGALAVDPKHPQTLYAGTYEEKEPDIVGGSIFKTTDGGATWRRTKRVVQDSIAAIAIDPHNTDVVYAETWGDVVKTADGGRTWRSVDPGPTVGGPALALDPRTRGTIYLGAGYGFDGAGVAKSVDGGRSWRQMNAGLTTARVTALAVAPGGRGTAYAAVVDRRLFKRVDGTWRRAHAGLNSEVETVAVDPRHARNVYAGSGAVFSSVDGGEHWTESSLQDVPGRWPEGGRMTAVAVDPENSSTVYAIATREATTGDGLRESHESLLFKSLDGGQTWPKFVTVRAVDAPAVPGEPVGPDVHPSPLAIDPRDPQVLYAGGRGVSKSSDGGMTWRRSGLGNTPVLALAIDSSQAKTLYAGTEAGVVKSTNAGASWQRLHGALDGARVGALAIDPEHHRTVFAGTDNGVSWTTDGGLTWHRFTHLPHRPFNALAVDRSAGLLYAGADGGGIFELKLGR
jgi:photosystem II stability/assembly factor-like uncharacterized protein